MKKNILAAMFATACLAGCAFGLAACSGGDGGGSNPPAKTLTYISGNVNHSKWDGSQFIYEYGDVIEISESNFSVTAYYSDNSNEVVTDFTLDKSQLPSGAAQEGTYTISVTYSTASPISYNVVVNPEGIEQVSFAELPGQKEVDYTGNEIDIVAQIPALQALIDANKVVIDEQNSTKKATDADTYYLRLETAEGYQYATYEITWIIKKAVVEVPTVSNAEIEYDGNSHSIEFTETLPGYMTLEPDEYNDESYTNAGFYYYTLKLDNNHIFSGNIDYASVTMVIKPKALDVNRDDLAVTGTYVYTPDGITLNDINHNIDTDFFDVVIDAGLDTITSAGSYYLYATPKDEVGNNYAWKNGDTIYSYEEVFIGFDVSKATPDYSGIDTENNVIFETTYSESLTFGGVIANHCFREGTASWMTENLDMNRDWYSVQLDDETLVSPGTHTKTISYTPSDNNYEVTQIAVKIVINKRKIIISNCDWEKYKIDGEGNETWTNNSLMYDGTTTFKYVLSDYSSYDEGFVDDAEVDLTYVTYYGTEEGVYDETQPVTTAINGGYYKTVAHATLTKVGDRINTDNYSLDDYYEIAPFEKSVCEWEVAARPITHGSWNLFFDDDNANHIMYLPKGENALTTEKIKFKASNSDITVTKTFYYRSTPVDPFRPVTDLTEVGYYRATAVLDDYNHNNYDVNIDPDEFVLNWQMLPNSYDLSEVRFNVESGATLNYGVKVEDLFDNLLPNINVKFTYGFNEYNGGMNSTFWSKFTNGHVIEAGEYRVSRVEFSALSEYDYYLDGTWYHPKDYVEITGDNLASEEDKPTLKFGSYIQFSVVDDSSSEEDTASD